MAKYVFAVAEEFNYPQLTVYKKMLDGVQTAWRVNANEGYVFYDVNATDTELDPETMEEIPVTYYYTVMHMPLNYNFTNFHWAAVARESVEKEVK